MKPPTNHTDSGMCYYVHSTSSCSLTFMSHHQDCIFPATIDHGHYKEVNGLWTNEVLYECDEGYSLVGQARLSCNSSGWSSPAPQCKGNFSSIFSSWLSRWNCHERIPSKVSSLPEAAGKHLI